MKTRFVIALAVTGIVFYGDLPWASAQIGGAGTPNYIPLWTSSVDLGSSNIYQSGTKLGIGTTSPLVALDVLDTSDPYTIRGTNSRAGGTGVFGTSGASHNGIGVYGLSTNSSGFGVLGSNKAGGIAIGGIDTLGIGIGIKGVGQTVSGSSSQLTERPLGVWGTTSQLNGVGVAGTADDGFGVLGINLSADTAAGYFENLSTEGLAAGVEGQTVSATGYGVYGLASDPTGSNFGVYGQTDSTAGTGVNGIATGPTGPGGYPVGVQGSSTHGTGVSGVSTDETGVIGFSINGNGVAGLANNLAAGGYFANGGGGYIILGVATVGGPNMFSVDGAGNGFFAGNLNVTGTLTKGGGSFKIDDPLDPSNKYLSHSFVESPDMKNIYDGVTRLDVHGEAWVELPDYFDALNRDFRYQLTSVGASQPGLYIAREVKGNRFRIAGGKAGAKVSWQVTGIRKDAWANAHRIATEEDKPAEKRGTYLYPELYNASADKNTDAIAQQ